MTEDFMHSRNPLAQLFFCFLVATSATAGRCDDDPLQAFPTSKNPIEDRVHGLTDEQLEAIRLPEKEDHLVFSYVDGQLQHTQAGDNAEVEPLLRVYADGRIDCGNAFPQGAGRCKDTISDDELTWLLHLAINECRMMDRSSDEISDAFQKRTKEVFGRLKSTSDFRYHVALESQENYVSVPYNALVVRPLRSKMQLGAFASLNKYGRYLISRAWLGDPPERQAVLDQVNSELKKQHPTAPPFEMEHLGAAGALPPFEFAAMFQQEIELQDNHFKEFTANVMRKDKSGELTMAIRSKEYQKYRPMQQ